MSLLKTLLRYTAWAYLAWVAIAVLLLSPAAHFLAPRLVQEYTGRSLHTSLIFINPFTLSVTVRHAAVPEPDGARFLAFERAVADLSLSSLWHPGWVLDELSLLQLYLHVRRTGEATYNFSDMLGGAEQAPQDSAGAPLPGLTVNHLLLDSERLRYSDEHRQEHFSTHLDGFGFVVQKLSTVIEEGRPYELRATDESGGQLAWTGSLSLPRGESEGAIRLDNISLLPAWRFFAPMLAFRLDSGTLQLQGNYRLSWHDGLDYSISDGGLALQQVSLAPLRGDPARDTHIRQETLSVTGVQLVGGEQRVEIDAVTLDGLDVAGWNEDTQLSLVDMFALNLPENDAPAAATGEPWQLRLGRLQVNQARLDWHSNLTDPQDLALHPINVRVEDVQWPAGGAAGITLDLAVNQKAGLSASGTLDPVSGDGELALQLTELPLPWFNPNLPRQLQATVDNGQLSSTLDISLAGFAPARVALDGAIEAFEVGLDGVTTGGWGRFSWEGLELDPAQRVVSAALLSLERYYGRLHIYADGTVNSQRLIQERMADTTPGQPAVAADDPAEAANKPSAPWQFDFPLIRISDSKLDFLDQSLPLEFSAAIARLGGDITNLGSDPTQAARIDLKGLVDDSAPLFLTGSVKPMAEPLALNLALAFQGMDLARVSPYSGTYVGRHIDRGVLTLDLRYALDEGRLAGDNRVVIDKLELGARTASEKAANLPLDLAIALLTDSNGIMDLQVPVSGNVDDPEFGLGSVIWKAFANLIIKAATAPFKLLANLVGSDQDLEQIAFAPGSEQLDSTAQAALRTLAEALAQRPTLKLGVSGLYDPINDRLALQDAALSAQLLAMGLAETDISGRNEAWAKAVGRLYRDQVDSEGEPPPAANQYDLLRARMEVPLPQLQALAKQRAAQAKSFLVTEAQVAADRVFLQKPDQGQLADGFAGIRMLVEA